MLLSSCRADLDNHEIGENVSYSSRSDFATVRKADASGSTSRGDPEYRSAHLRPARAHSTGQVEYVRLKDCVDCSMGHIFYGGYARGAPGWPDGVDSIWADVS